MGKKKEVNYLYLLLAVVLIIVFGFLSFFYFERNNRFSDEVIFGPAVSSDVSRTFDRSNVYEGDDVVVTLTVRVQSGHECRPYTIREVIPSGWTYVPGSADSACTYVSGLNEIRCLIERAPGEYFYNGVDCNGPGDYSDWTAYHSYTITAPSSSGTSVFSGSFVFADQPSATPVSGSTNVIAESCPGLISESNCNNIDDDCDYIVDEGCDDDEDNYCDSLMIFSASSACSLGGNDCDDEKIDDPAGICPTQIDGCSQGTSECAICKNPGAIEFCDGIDNNCNSNTDETYTGETCQFVCESGGDIWTNNGGNLNCCGNNANEDNPYQASEVSCSDGNDNDCDGFIDILDSDCSGLCTNAGENDFYVSGAGDCNQCDYDDDNDGDQPGVWTSYSGMADTCDSDCGIVATTVQLTNFESGSEASCDGIDNNCDGSIDEPAAGLCTYSGNNLSVDAYTCVSSGCICTTLYEEDDTGLSWTIGDCTGCVSMTEITNYGFNWLNGALDSQISDVEVTNAVDRWVKNIGAC